MAGDLRKTYLTKEGYKKLLLKEEQLEAELKKAQKRVGEAAGEEGMWHENAAFEQAEADVSLFTRLLGEVKDQIATAQIVEHRDSQGSVAIGSTVKVKIGGSEDVFVVVGENESDPVHRKVSYNSPIGKALLGAKKGDLVKADTPGGNIEIKITEII